MLGGEGEVKAGEGLEGFGIGDVVFRHEAHHLAAGHFAHGGLFNEFAVLFLGEYAGDEAEVFGEMF